MAASPRRKVQFACKTVLAPDAVLSALGDIVQGEFAAISGIGFINRFFGRDIAIRIVVACESLTAGLR